MSERPPRNLLVLSGAWGIAMTILAAVGFFSLASVGKDPGWLRSPFVALGLIGSPFWWFTGIIGAWTGGANAGTISLALVANVLFWAAAFYVVAASVRFVRRPRS